KISQLDVLTALEPNYKALGDVRQVSRAGFSPEFIRSLMERYALCARPFKEMCRVAANLNVKNVMYTPTQGEYVEKDASLWEAIHQFVIGRHQSLLVTHEGEIVGILRLTDVFKHTFQTMKTLD
ncbi:MAG: CBS domain-containing protein, partial [Thermodesulfobacteriota bacterium]